MTPCGWYIITYVSGGRRRRGFFYTENEGRWYILIAVTYKQNHTLAVFCHGDGSSDLLRNVTTHPS
jgi:hypothetical protein